MNDKPLINKLFNEQNHLNEEGIAWYAEHLIHQQLNLLPPAILEHVMDCPHCKMQCMEVAGILRLQHTEDMNNPGRDDDLKPPGIFLEDTAINRHNRHTKSLNYWLPGMVAGFIILIGVGWFIMNGLKNNKEETPMIARQITVPDRQESPKVNTEISSIDHWVRRWNTLSPGLEEHYKINSSLEALIKMMFRSPDFIMVKPDSITEIHQGDPLIFQWEDKKSKELILKLMNNQGNLVHRRVLKHHSVYEVKKDLSPGLYYWFIEQAHYTVAGGRLSVLIHQ